MRVATQSPAVWSTPLRWFTYAVVEPCGRLTVLDVAPSPTQILPLMQAGVGGTIEMLRLGHGLDAVVNDEGLCLGLADNPVGSELCARLTRGLVAVRLCGPIVVVGNDGPDTTGLTPDQKRIVVETWSAIVTTRYLGWSADRP